MKDRNLALESREIGQTAIRELRTILDISKDRCTDEEFDNLKNGVAWSIEQIEIELLAPIYRDHPDLDELR